MKLYLSHELEQQLSPAEGVKQMLLDEGPQSMLPTPNAAAHVAPFRVSELGWKD